MVLGKKWILKKPFQGVPTPDNFELVQEELPEVQDGELLISTLFLSVDPYMRIFPIEKTMIGENVAKIVESKDQDFPAGSLVVTNTGWVHTAIINPKVLNAKDPRSVYLAPNFDFQGYSPSYLLGTCGMPGITAYFGLLDKLKPKSGETIIVNGAAGAVGSVVGQIAKIFGCKVVGFAGTDEKCRYLTEELGFDQVYNYKKGTIKEMLKECLPNGAEMFFDNVGGKMSSDIINHGMKEGGRIVVCGSISYYNDEEPPLCPATSLTFIIKTLKMEGLIFWHYIARWSEGINDIVKWIGEGKLKVKETITEGFENAPEAFIGLFNGVNNGKMIVKP